MTARLLLLAAFALAATCLAPAAFALSPCVNTLAELKNALSDGASQTTPYTIRIATGTYALDAPLDASFGAPTIIEGGYGANCATRSVDPANTVIDLGLDRPASLRQPNGAPMALLAIEGVTFRNANKPVRFAAGSAGISPQHSGHVRITRSAFRDIAADDGLDASSIAFEALFGDVILENVLFNMPEASGSCVVKADLIAGARMKMNHVTLATVGNYQLCLDDHGGATDIQIHNSIIGSPVFVPPFVRGTLVPQTTLLLANTLVDNVVSDAAVTIENPVANQPIFADFEGGNLRLHTLPAEPAINAGTTTTPLGEPETDIEGKPRKVGSKPDLGAYESPVNDSDLLLVTNTHDNGAGSLRQAMLEANVQQNGEARIAFDIRDGSGTALCPAVIKLDTPLPAIERRVEIDAGTQPGAIGNTSADAFNAKLCVLLKPAAASLNTAFRVQAEPAYQYASLTLRGFGIGGFNQPVMLLGGYEHQIAGNQFGGKILGVDLPPASQNAIAIGVKLSGNTVVVGGRFLGDRNVIVDAGLGGVSLRSDMLTTPERCKIVNNLIGLAPDGITAAGNFVGIHALGSSCSIERNRIAGNTAANLWLGNVAGSVGQVVQRNSIGIGATVNGVLNDAPGILVTGPNNTIGAHDYGNNDDANTIRFNGGGGIVVRGANAMQNAIRANLIDDNGVTGNGMDIDLQDAGGGAGPTPNDAGDDDTGGNGLLNFPQPLRLEFQNPHATSGGATLVFVYDPMPGTYRIEAYLSDKSSTAMGRGHAQQYVTNANLVVAGPVPERSMFVSLPATPPGTVLSLVAIDPDGNTSEISAGLRFDTALFSDEFE